MKKIILLASLAFSINAFAQIPQYVPTNGLVGYWTFDGNGNDLSSNANNLTTNGNVSYSTDRFGNTNSAALFDAANEYFNKMTPVLPSGNASRSLSIWLYTSGVIANANGECPFIYGDLVNGGCYKRFATLIKSTTNFWWNGKCNPISFTNPSFALNWTHFVITYDSPTNSISLFQNGQLILNQVISGANNTTLGELRIGSGLDDQNPVGNVAQFDGKIDEVAFYDRVLTQQEITSLSQSCNLGASINPAISNINTNFNAVFSATTNDPNATYQWQTNGVNLGWQNVPINANYTGATSNSLTINNVQLANHLQPFRVIATSGSCIDTSNIATINITDTCIVTINDTITTLISVTDTLIINATVTGLTPPNNLNTIKVFPNPANSHITINYGNFASMSGYTLKITNNLGQVVFTSPINQQSSYIDLSTWTGNGIYFVQIIDNLNNTVENRKIVLQ
ncbi:MAG: T9SS type A sorting domain-containing protein [Bacteroidia bacterium]|nr:T9SS type A sorting domain-containing protein [Bacteroidia bacterium]